jgi:hypothetical protein
MTGPLVAISQIAAMGLLILFYYGWLIDRVGALVRLPGLVERLECRFPRRHVEAARKLTSAALLQACFALVLIALFQPAPLGWQALACDPVVAVLALALGIGEMGLSSLLGYAAIVIADTVRASRGQRLPGRSAGARPTAWADTARGGWMQYYIKTVAVLPRPISIALVLLYVFFEECIFRGIVLAKLLPFGAGIAIGVSTLFFMAVQVPHTPGWRTALFPVIGALVVGVVHGSLFAALPHLTPLALAHASFFLSGMWMMQRLDSSPRVRRLA